MVANLSNVADIQHGHIDDSIVPGTVYLVDSEHTLNTKHSKAHQDIVLVPTPSNDPEDPLNWSPRRKYLALSCMCVYVWLAGICSSVVYSVIVPLSESLGITVADINAGTGYLFLFAGWSLLFFQPFALQYGKRPTYLISVLGIIGATMWGPYANSNGQWIARCIINGLFASPCEALPEVTVSDLFFAHERGTYMGVYAFVLAGSNFFAPIVCGWINDRMGYKWVFYLPSIWMAAGFVFLFFFMEETNYDRKTVGMVQAGDESPLEGTEAIGIDGKGARATSNPESPSVKAGTVNYERKTYWQKLSFKDKPRPQRMVYRAMLSLRLLSWPTIFYAGFSYGCYLIWFNVLNGTASIVLTAEPYNFSAAMVGTSYIAALIGVIGGSLFTGYFSDWMTLRLVRRNGGVFEPEQRLWLFALTTIMLPASLILWGVGAAQHVHWFGLIVAMCTTAFCNTAGITLSVNYLVDSYRDISGDGMTTVMLIRNTMSFAIGYGITPWIDNLGTQNCFISAAFVGLAVSSVFLFMIWKGKSFREHNRVKYWALVRKHVEMSMVH